MLDYCVLIQGPLNSTSLDNLDNYKKIGPVLISYWNHNDPSILSNYNLEGCQLIKNEQPTDISYNRLHYNTFIYQIYSILYGLQNCQTKYTIRTRSDERYTLDKMIERFEQNPNKILCGNIFFHSFNHHKFHMGDHLFIGQTDILLKAYDRVCNNREAFLDEHLVEAIVAKSMLDVSNLSRTKENFKKLFDVQDINDLKPFIAKYAHENKTYRDNFPHCIKSMEDL